MVRTRGWGGKDRVARPPGHPSRKTAMMEARAQGWPGSSEKRPGLVDLTAGTSAGWYSSRKDSVHRDKKTRQG
jgi:hypothetical protein